MDTKERIKTFLGAEPAKRVMLLCDDDFDAITELRLRAELPMFVRLAGRDYVFTSQGKALYTGHDKPLHGAQHIYRPSAADIDETIERISQYSFYAFESELCQGYITLPGGHRVGVAGQAVIEKGVVRSWRHISSINFRVARSVRGCADGILPFLYEVSGTTCAKPRIFHTMIISPPGGGKTTLLRDIVRQISDGALLRDNPWQISNSTPNHKRPAKDMNGKNANIVDCTGSTMRHIEGLTVGLIDERSEVAGCFRGVAQNDVGLRTDVLDGCPKAEGMVMLLRAMSPDVIAVDELGGKGDAEAVEAVLTAGVRLLCTAHGNGLDDIKKNPALTGLVNRKVFQRYIVLSTPGKGAVILDEDGHTL